MFWYFPTITLSLDIIKKILPGNSSTFHLKAIELLSKKKKKKKA